MVGTPDGIRDEESTKQEDFSRQEQSHAELPGFELLSRILPVMAQMSWMIMMIIVPMAMVMCHARVNLRHDASPPSEAKACT